MSATPKESLGDRMKRYEEESKSVILIPPEAGYVIRADGHCFSKFTKGLDKPFDNNFRNAMVQTTEDVMHEFGANTAYTHSDEITLIFAPQKSDDGIKRVHHFNGRVMKIVGLISGYISGRFNYHIANQDWSDAEYTKHVREKMMSHCAYFDARLVMFPKEVEIVNHMIWRSTYDCYRNGISTLAHAFLTKSEMYKQNSGQLIKLLEDKGVIWTDYNPCYFRGVFIKRLKVPYVGINHKTGEKVATYRTKYELTFPEKLEATPEMLAWCFQKVLE